MASASRGRVPVVPKRIRGRADFERLNAAQREARYRAFEAIGLMRSRGVSLRVAAHAVGTTPETVRRYGSEALSREGRRHVAIRSDRMYHRMSVLSVTGLVDVDTRGSRIRSLVGKHWNAVHRYAATGDVSLLQQFQGMRIGGVELANDPDLVEEYLRQGGLDIDDIYV